MDSLLLSVVRGVETWVTRVPDDGRQLQLLVSRHGDQLKELLKCFGAKHVAVAVCFDIRS